jgi:exosortase A
VVNTAAVSSTVPNTAPNPAWWRCLPALVVLLFAVVLLYRETFWGMAQIWLRSETFTHGLFVLPISLWLIWRARASLQPLQPRTVPVVLLGMLLVAAAWLLGELVSVNAVTQLSAVALLVLAVFLMLGWQVSTAMLFPLGFLFFAVPLGEFLMPQFMEWTADFTVLALRLTGIPVYREGLQFIIPSGQWSVVEACSGIRYLIASLVVGTLFAYLNYRSAWRRWVFVGVAILVPVLANWLRAYLIVLLGHVSGNALATGADHLVYGWAFFGVVMLLMFMIGARWREDDTPAPLGLSKPKSALEPTPSGSAAFWGVAAAALVVVSLPHLWLNQLQQQQNTAAVVFELPPSFGSSWRRASANLAAIEPAFKNPSAQVGSAYTSDIGDLGVHVSYYRDQNAQRKLVSSQNMLVASDDKRWARVDGGGEAIAMADGSVLTARSTELRRLDNLGASREKNVLVWQLYWVDGLLTASDFKAKLYGARQRLLGRGDDGAIVLFYATRGNEGQGRAMLEKFLSQEGQALTQWLGQARDAASVAKP